MDEPARPPSDDPTVQADAKIRKVILEGVQKQLLEGKPPETLATMHRLMLEGHTRDDAIRLIAVAMSVEIYNLLKFNQPYNHERYIRNLLALPKLPFDDEPT